MPVNGDLSSGCLIYDGECFSSTWIAFGVTMSIFGEYCFDPKAGFL